MTIDEKAQEHAAYNMAFSQDELASGYSDFIVGARWMIEKATSWLQEHINDYLFDDGTPERPWLKCKSDMFDDFKKAMEE